MNIKSRLTDSLFKEVHIAPLVVFRLIFGMMMAAGTLRFALNGRIKELYISPKFHFPYYGFEWVKPLDGNGMYLLFGIMGISALFIAAGFFYRASCTVFFIVFTWIELIDKTNYLNHYYFISIVAFLLIWLPAGKYFSFDVRFLKKQSVSHIPRLFILTLQMQLAMVYFFAGVAKLNADWLLNAMPLRIWLQPHTNLPLIGIFMDKLWVAYLFSWAGAIYDLSIPFLLFNRKTRGMAYIAVIVFHILTRILFQIGMFPYIMILCTLIFFSENFHIKIIDFISNMPIFKRFKSNEINGKSPFHFALKYFFTVSLIVFFTVQILVPFRYLLYPGNIFWTEEGFRFSWRVMLMEKAGKTFFYVTDKNTGLQTEIDNRKYLTIQQEKMMATQPDMILQYAHFIGEQYHQLGYNNIGITADCYVALNGGGSRKLISDTTDLLLQHESFKHKKWINPFSKR